MRSSFPPVLLAGLTAAALTLAGCASYPASSPGPHYPTTGGYPGASAPQTLEYGRIVSIEYVPPGSPVATSAPNIVGAVVGGVAGAVLGRQIGGGTGRDVATVLGGVAGAAAGSQVGRSASPSATQSPLYRILVQTDQGISRTYEVTATGELRVGDRVRVENNVISRV